MKPPERQIQDSIIAAVRSNYVSSEDFMADLVQLLGLSRSGIYSKINGRTSFNFAEILIICKKYRLSLDHYVYENNPEETPYAFLSDAIRINPESSEDYIGNICNHLTQLAQFKNLKATYLANDVPLFYYIQFPQLMAFKLYTWDITNWKLQDHAQKFVLKDYLDNPNIWSLCKQLSNIYMTYPTVEIWNYNMMTHIIYQITFFHESGSFTERSDLIKVINMLETLVLFFRKQLSEKKKIAFGEKRKGESIDILLNEITINSEMINITSDQFDALYVLYDVPNYMRSYDKRICDHAGSYVSNIIDFSTPINVTGRKEREKLLDRYISDINDLKRRVGME